MPLKTILAISGSTRQHSSNELLLHAIASLIQEKAVVQVYTGINQLPHFNPDLTNGNEPAEVTAFCQKIASADAVLICTPEYVFSLPGTLKNALEWTVHTTVFSAKPAGFVVAAASGEKAFESLDLVLETLVQAPIPAVRKLLISGGQKVLNPAGDIISTDVAEKVMKLVEDLI